ncbi:MAG: glycoside hydrolase family 127 protein [Bacteroidaceae bacterium]|nr:glycoside hydrolase family 127 protein [Bacteroidaceae bacterium]
MKKILLPALLALTLLAGCANEKKGTLGNAVDGYPITPVPFTSVKVAPETFWGQRLQASREVTIPLAFSKCESEGRYRNFENAAKQMASDTNLGFKVGGYSFDDTDVYKTIEGASYLLQTYPDAKLKAYIDSVIAIMAAAQEPDGYLYTARTQNPEHPHEWAGRERWEKVEDLSHEFYNLGHMVEGAIAHYQATGQRNFLDIAIRYADCVCREIGPGEGQKVRVPGHQIAEMALAKLYLVTGDRKYLDEAKFFLDMRGKTERRDQYSQAHKPVVEQTEAWGHAVRAGYMYAGMADVAALTGDQSYIHAIDAIWDNIVSKKLYVTGGVGSTNNGEAFEGDYILPNMSAYCETCAAIANVYVNYRLFLLHGESKYYDVLERSLYNAVLSGISLDGGGFFYPNPLESMGQHQRQSWFGCACCPSNACRFIPSLPGYMYAVKDNNVYVNLFNTSNVALKVNGKTVELEQETSYPWEGKITLRVKKNKAGKFNLKVRYPGWAKGEAVPSDLYNFVNNQDYLQSIVVNGQSIIESNNANPSYLTPDGYITVAGDWKKGDTMEVEFRMDSRFIRANEHVEADRGKAAIQRGPLVYCAEWPDNDFNVLSTVFSGDSSRDAEMSTITIKTTPANQGDEVKEQTYPIVRISLDAEALSYDESKNITRKNVTLNLIPYYAWAHRGRGNMEVWLATQDDAAKPTWPDTYASTSKITGSHRANYSAINDHLLPKDSNDHSIPYFHWWPKEGTTEWICYEFPKAGKVSESTIWWFDDGPWGGCRVPKSWKLYYEDASGNFKPVQPKTAYGTKKDVANRVTFAPVPTKKLKLEVQLPPQYAAGLFEWEVK